MDFWTRLIVAGTLLSRIPLPIQSTNANYRATGWQPWIGRSLVLRHKNQESRTETEIPPTPTLVTGPPLPEFLHHHGQPVPVFVRPQWFANSPPVATKASKSFWEKAVSFLPTLLGLFGFGSTTNPKSKAAFDDIFRMFGIESNSVGVLAMNFLVFVAEKIANRFLPTDTSESRSFGDTKWFGLNLPSQQKISAITNALSDAQLTDNVINKLTIVENGNKTMCQQKLVCKLSPFIKGMQRYLFDRNIDNNKIGWSLPWTTRLYNSLPSLIDFKTTSDSCDLRFSRCLY